MAIFQAIPWHKGEDFMHEKLKTPSDHDNPTVPMLSQQAARTLQDSSLFAVGTIDSESRPWTSIWGGERGFSRPLGHSIVGIRTPVASRFDPVVEFLVGSKPDGNIVKEEGSGRMVSGLTFQLATRKRVKMFGRMVAGALCKLGKEASDDIGDQMPETEIQLVLKIEQSLGNCPKYATQREITSAISEPQLLSDSPLLVPDAVSLINRSDMFFITSRYEMTDMDTNYRGGPVGFVRVMSNETSTTVIWPEYSGNRLYQTLGNLRVTPLAGLCFPDFQTGNVLYLTGTTEILIGAEAADILPRSNLAVKLTVTAARFVAKGLPFRGTSGTPSPYNPQVRYLRSERPPAEAAEQAPNNAKLLSQTRLTPSISRFHFSLNNPVTYTSGQYVTFDFSSHLDTGYSHMRDDDPLSINDDHVRTFTVSNPPGLPAKPSQNLKDDEFEITIRKVGPVTNFLFKHGLADTQRRTAPPLEIDLKGFGGTFRVSHDKDNDDQKIGFIAAGVGITPLLPALPDLDPEKLVVLWTLRHSDVGLAADTLRKRPEFAKSFRIFFTGPAVATISENGDGKVEGDQMMVAASASDEAYVANSGAVVVSRRLKEEDVNGADAALIKKWFLCTSTPIREDLLRWLKGKETIYEEFNF